MQVENPGEGFGRVQKGLVGFEEATKEGRVWKGLEGSGRVRKGSETFFFKKENVGKVTFSS